LSYWVAVVARNAADHISATLQSLLDQTLQPTKIIVVNDGSSDDTREIVTKYLQGHRIVQLVNRPDNGYDIRRVPSNLNVALDSVREGSDYVMISGDDCVYPPSYVQSILERMGRDAAIVVASGCPSHFGLSSVERSPSGSGRVVRTNFLRRVGKFPVRAGWEAWLLYKAGQEGFRTQLFSDLVYAHVRPRGSTHRFTYWGAAMHTLGYHPLYALGRIVRNLIKNASVKSALGLLTGYLNAALGSSDPFMAPFDSSLRKYVRATQGKEIARVVSSKLGIVVNCELVDDRHLPT
jgi:glycosyltransferase involved in cell wall biosynthesis